MAKPRFFLPIEPGPCAGLAVEKGPRDEGVGRWVPDEKHTLLAKLLGGTRAARAQCFPAPERRSKRTSDCPRQR